MKEKIKEKFTIQNILCLFIILCPILDMASFIFRNIFNTNFSPSTIIRPIIPIMILTYLFFKEKMKLKLIIVGLVYGIYAILHLYLFKINLTQNAYSGVVHELQYLINYTFMILNLFIYLYTFKNKDVSNLKKSVLISAAIYIISIFISIITNTSSSTYIEKMGYKGWFESGNSISSILILSLFTVINMIKDKKYRYWIIGLIFLIGIYLTTLIGTRVGLLGFILVLFVYIIAEILNAILHKTKLNKKILVIALCSIFVVVIGVILVGSTTLQRRKHLQQIESNIIDSKTNMEAHLTGDISKIKDQIDEETLPPDYMSDAEKQSILDLYKTANELKVKNNDQRMQQLIYNFHLVKNQKDVGLILFGNGYMSKFRELVLEMEVPAFLFNFGVIGFILYFVPFFSIFIYGVYIAIKNRNKIDVEYLMILAGCFMSFAFGFLSGYTFFNSSTMIIIVVLNTILLSKVEKIKNNSISNEVI